MEIETGRLIDERSTDPKIIEHYPDTILSLAPGSIGEMLYVKLLMYYKTINAEGALYYWDKYEEEEE